MHQSRAACEPTAQAGCWNGASERGVDSAAGEEEVKNKRLHPLYWKGLVTKWEAQDTYKTIKAAWRCVACTWRGILGAPLVSGRQPLQGMMLPPGHRQLTSPVPGSSGWAIMFRGCCCPSAVGSCMHYLLAGRAAWYCLPCARRQSFQRMVLPLCRRHLYCTPLQPLGRRDTASPVLGSSHLIECCCPFALGSCIALLSYAMCSFLLLGGVCSCNLCKFFLQQFAGHGSVNGN